MLFLLECSNKPNPNPKLRFLLGPEIPSSIRNAIPIKNTMKIVIFVFMFTNSF